MDKILEALRSLPFTDEFKAKNDLEKATEVTPDLLKAAIEDIKGQTRKETREVLANDPDFTKQFYDKGHADAIGKERGTFEQQFKSVFADEVPLKDDNGMLPFRKVFESLREKLAKQGTEELQTQLAAANTDLVALKTAIEEGKHPAIEALQSQLEAEKQKHARINNMQALQSMLPPAEQLVIDPSDAAVILSNELDRSFKWGLNPESQAFEILTKDGQKPMTEDKTKVIDDPAQITRSILEKRGYIKKNPGKPEDPPGGKGGDPNPTDPQMVKKTGYAAVVQKEMEAALNSYKKEE